MFAGLRENRESFSARPLPRIPNLSNALISVFPEQEEFLIVLQCFALRVYLILFSTTYFTYLTGPKYLSSQASVSLTCSLIGMKWSVG